MVQRRDIKLKLKYTFMVQYPRPYGFTRLYASRSEDLTITSRTQTCFNPAHTSTPLGAFSPCCCKQRNRLLNHIAISSCQILSYGWVNQSPNDSIAVASNTRPSDYESDTLPLRHQSWIKIIKFHWHWAMSLSVPQYIMNPTRMKSVHKLCSYCMKQFWE